MTPFDLRCWELTFRPDLIQLPGVLVDLIKAHKFLMSDGVSDAMADFADQLIVNDLFVLPFDPVLLEFRSETGADRIAFLATKTPNGSVMVIPFHRLADGRWNGGLDYHVILDLKNHYWHPSAKYQTTSDLIWCDRGRAVADVFAGTIALLTSKICDISEQVVPSDKIQKHRKNLGRPPLFDYRIIKLSPVTNARDSDSLGGTHQSPALHWRRGHIRRLGQRLVPVSPCLVGDIQNGFVRKDYDASALNRKQSHGNIAQIE